MTLDSQVTIWQSILDNTLNTKKKENINVIILGDKNAGKKRLIELIAKSSNEFILFKNDIKK
jgi:hypothetical protein